MTIPVTHPSRIRHGFTLVELLVVISVVTMLVALLLPSLAAARDRARTVLCMANQKQLFMSIVMYGSDFTQLVPGGPWEPSSLGPPPVAPVGQNRGYSVSYRSNWYVGGSILWTDKGHTQQMLGEYISMRSPGWMCPGWGLDDVFITGDSTVGSPDNPTAGPLPFTMRNIGFGYNYRPWIRKVYQWPGWENYILKVEGPHNPSAADLFACLWYDNPAIAPHTNSKYWNVSFLDGSVRATAGLEDTAASYNMLGNVPPDTVWANWTGP